MDSKMFPTCKNVFVTWYSILRVNTNSRWARLALLTDLTVRCSFLISYSISSLEAKFTSSQFINDIYTWLYNNDFSYMPKKVTPSPVPSFFKLNHLSDVPMTSMSIVHNWKIKSFGEFIFPVSKKMSDYPLGQSCL